MPVYEIRYLDAYGHEKTITCDDDEQIYSYLREHVEEYKIISKRTYWEEEN